MPAARLGGLDHQAIQKTRRGRLDLPRPRPKELAAEVEVEQFEIAGGRAREQTQPVMVVGEPRRDLGLGRQAALILLPRAQRGPLPRAHRGQYAESGSQIPLGRIPHHVWFSTPAVFVAQYVGMSSNSGGSTPRRTISSLWMMAMALKITAARWSSDRSPCW